MIAQITKLQADLEALRSERYSWWTHWRELANYILPRRYTWLVPVTQTNRGQPLNNYIIDSTGTMAARTCASGMMSGIASPGRPWFKLKIEGFANNDTSNPISLWLAECEKRMMRVFQESNFYTSIATMFEDLTVFGTAPMIIYEDFDDVIRCYNPCAGEYFLANSPRLQVNTFFREFIYTARQMADEFGEENMSQNARGLLRNPGGSATTVTIAHCIKPNDGSMPERFTYCEYYWEKGNPKDTKGNEIFLRKKGFFEFPVVAPRWSTAGNDAYGRSPGMDALGDIKQLQQETKRKAQALDKMVNPPLVGDVQLKNQPATQIPGGLTYVSGINNAGLKPIFTVMPPIQEIMLDIQEIQNRIRNVFFNDLFMMISQLQTVRSATEIDARREEKLVMLGPVLEKFDNEGLDPTIDRVFNIMLRGGLLPEPPEEVQGQHLQVQYTSMLATAQNAASTASIERLFAQAGSLVAIQPDIMDNIDADEGITEYADKLDVPPKLIRTKEEVDAIRQIRMQQKQAMDSMAATDAMAKAGKTMSETDVGGGQNAIQMLMGGM